MAPIVDGKVHTFEHGGLYDGLFLMRDQESGSTWNHMTGECVYGPLKGAVLEVGVLDLMNVAQAVERFPEAQLALSNMGLFLRLVTRIQLKRGGMEGKGMLPPGFRRTMGTPDARLPEMEIGLGVWSGEASRFYSRGALKKAGGAVLDRFAGRTLAVYLDPQSGAPAAVCVDARSVSWQGAALDLGNGTQLREGTVRGKGPPQSPERPLQMLTRWYGFQYTFPGCDIFTAAKTA